MRELTITENQEIIRKDESRTLEVKETTGEIVKAMCSACAFLNSDGGWLVFGVTPKLKIVGQQVTDNTKKEIANHLRKIEPSINVSVLYLDIPEKTGYQVIAIYFDPTTFTNAPYTYDGRAYYKLESTTAMMPRQMYEERLRMSSPERFSWERQPNPDLSVEDLDEDLVFLTLQDGVNNHRIHASALAHANPNDILAGLGLMTREGTLLNAANVLFGKNPIQCHLQCSIRLARFEGVDKMEFRFTCRRWRIKWRIKWRIRIDRTGNESCCQVKRGSRTNHRRNCHRLEPFKTNNGKSFCWIETEGHHREDRE